MGFEYVNFTGPDHSKWTLDSSAKPHVCNDASMFIDMHDKTSRISGSIGMKQLAKRGRVKVQITLRDGSTMNHFLNDVIYNPDSPINICSMLQMYNKAGFKLDMDSFSVRDKKGAEVATVY